MENKYIIFIIVWLAW